MASVEAAAAPASAAADVAASAGVGAAEKQVKAEARAEESLKAPAEESVKDNEEESVEAKAEAKLKARGPRFEFQQKFFADFLASRVEAAEKLLAPFKQELLEKDLKGRAKAHAETAPGTPFTIVELGIGTGPNLKYYACPGVKVLGFDPNGFMEEYAKEAAEKAGLKPEQLVLGRAVGEGLPVPDASADAVVCTLVLCSVDSLKDTMSEVFRVLKPGGKFYFVEHVAAPDGSFLRGVQTVMDPGHHFLFDGCSITRNPVETIKDVGFENVESEIKEAPLLPYIYHAAIGHATKPV